jgi:hypothetical protein
MAKRIRRASKQAASRFADLDHRAGTVATHVSPDEWRPRMKDLAEALESHAEMLRGASGYEVEVVRVGADNVD